MKNKKGFTLVELLAVIVILALIMSIAIVSIGGVLKSSRESTFKETALSIINGVKMQLTVANQLKPGTYYFDKKLLDSDNELPFGGKINYTPLSGGTEVPGTNKLLSRIASPTDITASGKCTKDTSSYVSVTNTQEKYVFSICLTPLKPEGDNAFNSSQKFIAGTEEQLLSSTSDVVKAIE